MNPSFSIVPFSVVFNRIIYCRFSYIDDIIVFLSSNILNKDYLPLTKLLTAFLQIKRTLKFKFQCSEFKLNDSFGSQYGSLSQYSFCETFRSLCARKWRANCDTLWTAATGIKSRRGRYFVDVRGNIRACRSSRRKAGTRRATSTGTSSEKRL